MSRITPEALEDFFSKAGSKAYRRVFMKATRRGIVVIQKEAKANIPKVTGAARKQLRVAKKRDDKRFNSPDIAYKFKYVTPKGSGKIPHVIMLNFGTKRGIKPGRFIERAFDKKQSEAGTTIHRMIDKFVVEEFKKAR